MLNDIAVLKQITEIPSTDPTKIETVNQLNKFDLRNKTLTDRHTILKTVIPKNSPRMKLLDRRSVGSFDELETSSKHLVFKRGDDAYYPTGANTTAWLRVDNPTLTRTNAENKIYTQIETLGIVAQLERKGRIISGTAIREGYHNGKFYPFSELQKAYKSLIGKELRFGHQEYLKVGIVTDAWLNHRKKSIEFSAEIENELMSTQVAMGDYDAVSVGLWLNVIPTVSFMKAPIVEDLDFTELSIVRTPACVDAKITHVEELPVSDNTQ